MADVTLKLSRIDSGVETTLWQGVSPLNPVFLRTGWQTQFNANVESAAPPVVVEPPPPPPPVEPPPVEPPPVEPPPVEVPPEEPPVVVPPPVEPASAGTILRPANETELRQALQWNADNNGMCLLAQTKLDLTQTIEVQCRGNDGGLWGLVGNGARLNWKGPAGGDMLVFQGAKQVADSFQTNRGLLIEKITLDGQGTAGQCLTLRATHGDQGSIYKSALRDIFTMQGKHGIVLEGAVFESYLDNPHAENCSDHGMVTKHLPDFNGRRNIISNINIVHPNFSRNRGAGLLCTYSTNLTFGSFVLNALAGVLANDGLRYAVGCNGENTGEALFNVQYKGYGSHIRGNEVSSDGSTHYRAFEGGKWVSYGSPCLYILSNVVKDILPGEDFGGNHCSYYGGGTDPMRPIK
jgi:hypothetical protein